MGTTGNFTLQNNVAGELSPKLRGRYDLGLYYQGAEKVNNFITEPQGPMRFRTGTQFIIETKNNNPGILIPYQSVNKENYIIEITQGFFRFYKNKAIIESAPSVPVEVASPYLEAELFELNYAISEGVMYIVHPNHEPRKLTRVSDTSWTLATYTRTFDPGFTSANNYPSTVAFYESRLIFAGTNNKTQTLWFSRSPDGTGATRYDDFKTGTDADHALVFTIASQSSGPIQWLLGTNKFLGIGTTSAEFKATGTTADEAIAPDSINIRPISFIGSAKVVPTSRESVILFVEKNLRTLRALDFDFATDNFLAKDRNIFSDQITKNGMKQMAFQSGRPDILWIITLAGELLGHTFNKDENLSGWHRHLTRDGDTFFSVATIPQSNNFDEIWTITKRTINSNTKHYVELFSEPVTAPEFIDSFSGLLNKDTDVSNFRNLMFESQKTYKHLDSFKTYDGSLAGSSASASLTVGAVSGTGINFTTSAAIFSSGDVGRQLWKKSITGVEIGRAVIKTFNSSTSVDCDIIVNFDSTTTISPGNWYLTTDEVTGLTHLESESVTVVTDGGRHPDKTVSSGNIDLDSQVSIAHVGLKYEGLYKSMNLEALSRSGTSQGRIKNIHKIVIKFLETLGAEYGTDIYELEEVLFRGATDLLDRPPTLFSGEKELPVQDGWETDKHIFIRQENPMPCIIQLMSIFAETTDSNA